MDWADRIVAMDQSHSEMAARVAGRTPVDLVTDYLPLNHARHGAGVPDPLGGDIDAYEATYDTLLLAVRGLFDALRHQPEGGGGA